MCWFNFDVKFKWPAKCQVSTVYSQIFIKMIFFTFHQFIKWIKTIKTKHIINFTFCWTPWFLPTCPSAFSQSHSSQCSSEPLSANLPIWWHSVCPSSSLNHWGNLFCLSGSEFPFRLTPVRRSRWSLSWKPFGAGLRVFGFHFRPR